MSVSRNAPCPCGSGKKYKRCCLGSLEFEGDSKPAVVSLEKQLELAEAAFSLGDVARARRALEPLLSRPRVPAKAWAMACRVEMGEKNFDLASSHMARALEQEPRNSSYLYNYATALALGGVQEQALTAFRKALEIKPDLWAAYSNLGNLLRDLGRSAEAIECYREAFYSGELPLSSMSQILVSMQLFCTTEHDELFEMHCHFGRVIAATSPPVTPRNGAGRRGKIRLGYISPRFSREIVGYFFKPLFDNHDRDRFEIYLYCATPRTDDMTDYLSRRADRWTVVGNLSDTALCRRIAEDGIDILVDLAGHAPENRITAIARKPAPIQVSMLDYFDTTGLPTMDYYVTDRFSTPDDSPQQFTEELIFLDRPRLVYEAPDYAPPVSVRPPQQAELVFGSFNRHHKIVPQVVATWSRLLSAVENSRLVLKGGHFAAADVQDSFLRQFKRHGIDGARIEFRGASPHRELLAEYGDIDIALDTFPYNGGLTTCEALWMGTPVIAMLGERIISRQTAGMLEAVGLGDFIAGDSEAFAAIGQYWSRHREQLNELRHGLRGRMAASPLTDGAAYAADLEVHLRRIWEDYLAVNAKT
jgi:predicted O-linked N-acetylglucosamine transferase (SPINDLY family)